jgi:DNA repair protein RecO (recombination protein O)
MALIKTKGIVIKEIPFNDTDKMLTLLTADFGKVSVYAKNARRNGSRASYGTQVLTYGEYVLFKGRERFSLNSCDVLVNYYELASDITRFTHAAHMLDIASDVCSDPAASAHVLNILLYGLQALKKGRAPLLVSSAFALKTIQIAGYPPHISSCAICNTKEIDNIYFSFPKCGIICEECVKGLNDAVNIDTGAAKAILYVLCAEYNKVYNFELSEKSLKIFSNLVFRYIGERLDKNYNKLAFLNEFKAIGRG